MTNSTTAALPTSQEAIIARKLVGSGWSPLIYSGEILRWWASIGVIWGYRAATNRAEICMLFKKKQELLVYRLKPIKARVETVYRISQLGVGREQGQNSHMWAHEHTS